MLAPKVNRTQDISKNCYKLNVRALAPVPTSKPKSSEPRCLEVVPVGHDRTPRNQRPLVGEEAGALCSPAQGDVRRRPPDPRPPTPQPWTSASRAVRNQDLGLWSLATGSRKTEIPRRGLLRPDQLTYLQDTSPLKTQESKGWEKGTIWWWRINHSVGRGGTRV